MEIFIFGLVNFGALVAALYIFLKKLSRQFFYARRANIKKEMTVSAHLLREAKQRALKINILFKRTDEDIATRKNLSKINCDSECKIILEEANRRASHIIESAHKFGRDERAKALLDMRNSLALEAIRRAEEKIKKRLDNSTSLKITRTGLLEYAGLLQKNKLNCEF